MDKINEYFRANPQDGLYTPIYPSIKCADGFSISVQGHHGAYCQPRDNEGPYYEVECGFPSGPVPELANWKDGEGKDEESVYGYVPVEAVERLIAAHGGFEAIKSGDA
jgi:hypothetical protein